VTAGEQGGELLSCVVQGDTWIVSASAKNAYDISGYNPVNHAIRHLIFHAGSSPFLFVFDDIQAANNEEHVFDRILHLPEVVAIEGDDSARKLRLRFGGIRYDAVLAGGAIASTAGELISHKAAPPFRKMSIIRDRVRARNPYFWMLAACKPSILRRRSCAQRNRKRAGPFKYRRETPP
jgi:hypothetical protein